MKKLTDAVKKMVPDLLATLNGLSDDGMTEAEKILFQQFRETCQSTLSTLVQEQAVESAWDLSAAFTTLANAVGYIGNLNSTCKRLSAELAATANSADKLVAERLPAEVEKAMAAKVQAGEYLDKATANSLCEAAKLQGFTEGKTAALAEVQASQERAAARAARVGELTQNSLGTPPEAVLDLPEDQFRAAVAATAARRQLFQEYGITPDNTLYGRIWASEVEFAQTQAVLEAVPALKPRRGEPLASAPAAAADLKPQVLI